MNTVGVGERPGERRVDISHGSEVSGKKVILTTLPLFVPFWNRRCSERVPPQKITEDTTANVTGESEG